MSLRTGGHAVEAIISPSLLAANFARLGEACDEVLAAGADFLHLDMMDGHFVPNWTFGPPVVRAVRGHCPDAVLDVHVMAENPEKWVSDTAAAGGTIYYTFHWEATDDAAGLAAAIHDAGMLAGVAIKPGTPSSVLDDELLGAIDMALVMTVEPGFGGQSFMADMMGKVEDIRARAPGLHIEVDGGLSPATIDVAAAAGANVIVAGSAIFKADDKAGVIQALRDSVLRHQAATE